LDVPIGTVRSRIARARQRMAAALGLDASAAGNEFCTDGQANA